MRLTHPDTLAGRARGLDRGLGLALAGALGLLVAGWTWPMMTVSRFVWLQDEVSLMNATLTLYDQGDWLLFAVLAVFAFAFPLVKLIAALWVFLIVDARHPGIARALDVLDLLGRWSMLDVFVAACWWSRCRPRWLARLRCTRDCTCSPPPSCCRSPRPSGCASWPGAPATKRRLDRAARRRHVSETMTAHDHEHATITSTITITATRMAATRRRSTPTTSAGCSGRCW